MRSLIKKLLLESLLNTSEDLQLIPVNDIDDDNLYDNLIVQSQKLKNQETIGFNGSIYSVIFNKETGELASACWLEDNASVFSPHFIVSKNYRNLGLFTRMLLDAIKKYILLKKYRDDYPMIVNAINPEITNTLIKNNFKKYKDNSYIYNSDSFNL